MPLWGRRTRQMISEVEQREALAKEAAREAVSRVTACFVSDPDIYEVRAAIVVTERGPNLMVLQLVWDDDDCNAYLLGDAPSYPVRHVLPAHGEAEARAHAEAWIGDSIREVSFNLLPGLYQEAYARPVAGPWLPTDALRFLWVLPIDSDEWVVRLFPSGIGRHAPPKGEVGFVRMHRVVIEEMWRSRGW